MRIAITVGMSAPPIGMISSTPNSKRQHDDHRERPAAPRAPSDGATSATPSSSGDAEQREVGDVLQRIGHRPLGDPLDLLQLPGRHQAAGEGEEPEEDLDDDGDHPERRQVLAALAEPEVVLGRAHQPGRQAAERVRQRRPLGHRRERHPGERHADRERRRRAARTIQPWWTTSRLGPGGQDRERPCRRRRRTPPFRAVAGVFIQCSAKTNSAVATR